MSREHITRTYRVAMAIAWPVVRLWGRLTVTGLDLLPLHGPVLIVANHDSQWDPVVIGVAAIKRRQIRALAKSGLWKNKILGWVLNGMGQIPINRGQGDVKAMDAAVTALRDGACIGVFPEGTISRGQALRPRSGAGRLAEAVPQAPVISCRVLGSTTITRFPQRPRLRVEFFLPSGGQPSSSETPNELMQRVIAEIRQSAPYDIAGRKKTVAKSRAKLSALAKEDGESTAG